MKYLFLFSIIAFSFSSCTPESIQDNENDQQIEKLSPDSKDGNIIIWS